MLHPVLRSGDRTEVSPCLQEVYSLVFFVNNWPLLSSIVGNLPSQWKIFSPWRAASPLAVSFGFQVTALTLLKEEDFPSLGCLLSREFRPLSRLLVLLGWTHCQSLASAKSLLQTLHGTQVTHTAAQAPPEMCVMRLWAGVGSWSGSQPLTPGAWVSISSPVSMQDQGCDKLLRDACDGLWAHLEVLEWCVQQSRYSSVLPAPSYPHWAHLTPHSMRVAFSIHLPHKCLELTVLTHNK